MQFSHDKFLKFSLMTCYCIQQGTYRVDYHSLYRISYLSSTLSLTCWTSCFSIFAHNCCISIVTTSLSLSSTIFDWSCFSITKQFGHLPCKIKYKKNLFWLLLNCETQKTMNTRKSYGMLLCSKGKATHSVSVKKLKLQTATVIISFCGFCRGLLGWSVQN